MVTAFQRTRRPRLAKGEEGPPLSPVPEGAEAKPSASDDGKNDPGGQNGVDIEPCENGSAEAIFTKSTNCEGEESVTGIADDVVVNPHQMNSVYGDVLSQLVAVPFEAQSMLKFHQTKESSTPKGRRKRKKPSRKNTVPIYSQKQYLRGAGLMSLSKADLAEKEAKKKRRTSKSSPARAPVLHSNRTECAEFSPRSVKTLESPKRGVSQSPRKDDTTTATTDYLNSHINQDIAAIQEQALAQTQHRQLLINEHQNIASLHQEHELQLLQQQQQQQQQQPAYYDPLQAVHHHLYHQMLMSGYPYNPYLPFQQPEYQHISPQLLQPLLHGRYVNNPDDVVAAAVAAAEAANQNDYNGYAAYPNSNGGATFSARIANQDYNDFVAGAPQAGNHNTTTADLLAKMKAETAATASNAASETAATARPEQKLTKSDKQDAATLPVAFGRSLDSDESGTVAVSTATLAIHGEDGFSKLKPKKAAARPKKEVRREKQMKAANEKVEAKDNSKVVYSPGEKRNDQSGDNRVGNTAGEDFPPGWTTSTHQRKTGRGFYNHYVSPNNNTFRSRKNAISFIAILKELKKKNDGKEPSESEALAVFERRGHKR
eukprot:scaffold1200_cov109-Skeletonema_marinoi.AAC.5